MASGDAHPEDVPAAATGARIRTGAPMRRRARWMVAAAFLVSLPTLALGVYRTSSAEEATRAYLGTRVLTGVAQRLQLASGSARAALWRLEASGDEDVRNQTGRVLDKLSRVVVDDVRPVLMEEAEGHGPVKSTYPSEASADPATQLHEIERAVGRVREAIDPVLYRRVKLAAGASRRAHAALDTLDRRAAALSARAETSHEMAAELADSELAHAGRDVLVVLLLLLFLFPVLLVAGPAWMVQPLQVLRSAAARIETGRARELVSTGHDEVAVVTGALRHALARLEENGQRKTWKILEMKKLLREVIANVDDAVLVVGRRGVLDYANNPAAELLGTPAHNLAGQTLADMCFAPALVDAVECSRRDEELQEDMSVVVEGADGRVRKVHAYLGNVYDQQGQVSRVVVVLRA